MRRLTVLLVLMVAVRARGQFHDCQNQPAGNLNCSAGTVGIGTDTPNSILKLDVAGSAGATNLFISGMQASGTRFQQANDAQESGLFVVGSDYAAAGGYLVLNRQHGLASYGFIQVGDNNLPEPFVLNPVGGNVGIGTTTPRARLQIAGSDYSLSSNSAVKEFDVDFPNGIANQKCDLYMAVRFPLKTGPA